MKRTSNIEAAPDLLAASELARDAPEGAAISAPHPSATQGAASDSANAVCAQAGTSRWAHWTPEERALLKQHYADGGVAAVQAAGVNRTPKAIKYRASLDGISTPNASSSLLGNGNDVGTQSTLSLFPSRPARITDALHELAESNPTPATYEAEKARILAEATP